MGSHGTIRPETGPGLSGDENEPQTVTAVRVE
jgi:hypothetical protein